VLRYQPKSERNEKLREEIKRCAAKKVRWGAGQIYLKLIMHGWKVNHKRVERRPVEKQAHNAHAERRVPGRSPAIIEPVRLYNFRKQ
jgi:hypothetical protein